MAHPEQSGAAENNPTPEVSPQQAFFDRLFEEAGGDMTIMVSSIDTQPEAVAFAQAYGEVIAKGDAESRATKRKVYGDAPLSPVFKDAPHKQVATTVKGIIAATYEGDDITRLTREKMWTPVFKHIDNMVENGWMIQHILETHEFLESNERKFVDDSAVE